MESLSNNSFVSILMLKLSKYILIIINIGNSVILAAAANGIKCLHRIAKDEKGKSLSSFPKRKKKKHFAFRTHERRAWVTLSRSPALKSHNVDEKGRSILNSRHSFEIDAEISILFLLLRQVSD